MTLSRTRRLLASLAVTILVLAGCGRDGGSEAEGLSGELIVFAAASLTNAFEEISESFTTEHPDVTVTFNFAGSNVLATQINEGAPADVFASANTAQMTVVADAGNVAGESSIFVNNVLAIAVEAGNPFDIAGLADLANPDLILVLAAEEVPVGQYARQALDTAGVDVAPASLEADVRAALSKVELGEADATIVYATDIVSASDTVEGVDIPAEHNVPAAYPIAVLDDAPNAAAAEAFVAYVLGSTGQEILGSYGFAAP